MKHILRVGAGRTVVRLTPDCFPSEGFTTVHDDLHVRILLLEEDGVRFAILSAELTSMFPETIEECRHILLNQADVPSDRCWITVTHTFSSPHLWPVPKTGAAESPPTSPPAQSSGCPVLPVGLPACTPEERQRHAAIHAAWLEAIGESVRKAVSSLREARFGTAVGQCAVNANRNVETAEGWWLGCSAGDATDHSLRVMAFEALDGTPIGLLHVYACQSSVMDQSVLADGGRAVTGDLAGVASAHVEQDFGDDFVAIPLCGSAGDQAPQLRARTNWVDRMGRLHSMDLGVDGFHLLSAQGLRLGEEIVRTASCIQFSDSTDDPTRSILQLNRRDFFCNGKKIPSDLRSLKPTRHHPFEPDDVREMAVEALRIGENVLVGTRPELSARTGMEIIERSPFEWTAVVTMVNGGAKYMADASAYDRITYGAMNSMFMKGSAEKLRDEANSLLQSMEASVLSKASSTRFEPSSAPLEPLTIPGKVSS